MNFYYRFLLLFLLSISFTVNASFASEKFYLATFPRSGNGWTMRVMQELGVIGDTVYKSGSREFKGQYAPLDKIIKGVRRSTSTERSHRAIKNPNNVLLIKTHFPLLVTKSDGLPFKAIQVVRNPIDSFYSFTQLLFYTKFSSTNKMTTDVVISHIREHLKFYNYWDNQKDVFRVKYEDLVREPFKYFKKMTQGMGLEVSDEAIQRAIKKHPPKNYELIHLNNYSPDLIKLIEKKLKPFLEKYNYKTVAD